MKNIAKRLIAWGGIWILLFGASSSLLLNLSTGVAHAFSSGNGSSDYPYRVSSCAELQAIADDTSAHYALTDNLFCNTSWTPIVGFSGVLDGRNYSVYNISVNTPGSDNVGFFSTMVGGTVENLYLQNEYIIGNDHVGAVAGQVLNGSTISHVSVNASIIAASYSGGLAGYVDNGSTISSSSSSGTLTSATGATIGGLVGDLESATVTDSHSNVTIDAQGAGNSVGGLIGFLLNDVVVNRSYSNGTIHSSDGGSTGGLFGFVYGNSGHVPVISNNFTTEGFTGTSPEHGGVAGRFYQDLNMSNTVFDGHSTASPYCDAYGNPSGCSAVNTDGSNGAYFYNNTSVEPFVSGNWDFTTVWQTTANLPSLLNATLSPLAGLPAPLAPTGVAATANSASTATVNWTAPTNNGGGTPTDYVVEYKLSSDSSWTTFQDGNSTNTTALVTGLTPNTSYDFRVSTINGGGTGDPSDPATVSTNTVSHVIHNCYELQEMKFDLGAAYTLANDIECNVTSGWNFDSGNVRWQGFEPIADFSGTFDGAGHTISNLFINRPDTDNVGLFANIGGSYIHDVTVSGEVTGASQVGGLIGVVQANSTVDHVTSNIETHGDTQVGGIVGGADTTFGDISLTNLTSNYQVAYRNVEVENDYMGGVLGYAFNLYHTLTLTNLTAHGQVTAGPSAWGVGGVVGQIDTIDNGTTNISGLSANNNVYGQSAVGGLIGDLYANYEGGGDFGGNVTLTNSHASGDVTGTDTTGGLVGMTSSYGGTFDINQVYATGSVTSTESDDTGGLIGLSGGSNMSTSITQAYASGPVSGFYGVGGLVGQIINSNWIGDSYATGPVTGGSAVGGLVGDTMGSEQNTYATGTVTSDGGTFVGGLVGDQEGGGVLNSFAQGLVSNPGGTVTGGLVGNSDNSVTFQMNYYSPSLTSQDWCVGAGSNDNCTSQDMTGENADFYYNPSNLPLFNWDFSSTWVSHADTYPTLTVFDSGNTPIIHNCSQLQAMQQNLGGNYTLANDIDCSDTANWNDGNGFLPVGWDGDVFSGSLNGAGHTIIGLTEHRSGQVGVGLFGTLDGANIHDLHLADGTIDGWQHVGALAGSLYANNGDTHIMNVTTNMTVTGRYRTGGLVGDVETSDGTISISQVSTAGSVLITDGLHNGWGLGGVVGEMYADSGDITFTQSTSTATVGGRVVSDNINSVGGLIGEFDNYGGQPGDAFNLSGLTSSGGVQGSGYVGGLFGYWGNYNDRNVDYRTNLYNSSSSSPVSGWYTTGGLIGQLDAYDGAYVSVRGVSATGDISVTNGDGAIGGLIGSTGNSDGDLSIRQSYATGNITADSGAVGGFIGYSSDFMYVMDSYATGNITADSGSGGFLGSGRLYAVNTYASGNVTANNEGDMYMGGWAGQLFDNATVVNSFSTGVVTAPSNDYVAGFIGGYNDPNSDVLTNNYYNLNNSGQADCSYLEGDGPQANDTEGQCSGVNLDGNWSSYFIENTSNAPYDQWDFANTWIQGDSALPTLGAVSGLASVPSPPTGLSITGDRTNLQLTWSPPVEAFSPIIGYEVSYRRPNNSNWNELGFSATTSLTANPDLLSQWNSYDFRVTAITETERSDPSSTVTYSVGVQHNVSSCEDLQNIDNDLSGNYVLTQDIDCSGTASWNDNTGFSPIGMNEGDSSFTGTLDGQGHKITGLFEDRTSIESDQRVGLFYQTSFAHLENFLLQGGSFSGHGDAGAIAVYAQATAAHQVGSTADVTSSDTDYVGGLFGEFWDDNSNSSVSQLSNSFSTGTVTGDGTVGGLMGYGYYATVTDSYYNGNLHNTDGGSNGGIIGDDDGGDSLSNVYAVGSIVTAGGGNVGGLIGYSSSSNSSITNSFVATDLSQNDEFTNSGALIGYVDGDTPNIVNNYFDFSRTGVPNCTYNESVDPSNCQPVNTDGNDAAHFFDTTSAQPLDQWNFSDTWTANATTYPTLQGFVLSLEAPETEAVHPTSSRVTFAWKKPAGTVDHYEVQVKPDGTDDSAWVDYDYLNSPTATSVTVNGLANSSTYNFRVRAIDGDGNNGDWSTPVSATTTAQTYEITNCSQLQDIAGDLSGDYVLANDIDCSGTNTWNGGAGFWPIGDGVMNNGDFTGTLDGQGHTISGLTINRADFNAGNAAMILSTAGATVQNLHMTGGSVSALYSAAPLIAFSGDTSLVNVSASVDVTTAEPSMQCTGGLVACLFNSDPAAQTIDHVSATGNVIGENCAGGLFGYVTDAQISTAFATGNVTGTQSDGGLIGCTYQTQIQDAYTTGNVIASNSTAGGLIGYDAMTILINTYASGSVSSPDSVGGLIGSGDIFAVVNSFATGQVTGDTNTGGIVGAVNLPDPIEIDNSYWDVTSTGQSTCSTGFDGDPEGCAPVNTDGTQSGYFNANNTVEPLASWDFENTWILGDSGLPTFGTAPRPFMTAYLTRTDTTMTPSWTVSSNTGSPITSYELQYKLLSAGDDAWQDVPLATPLSTSATITGLLPATWYSFRIRATNSYGSNGWLAFEATTKATPSQAAPTASVVVTPIATQVAAQLDNPATPVAGDTSIDLNSFTEYTSGAGKLVSGLKVGQVIHFTLLRNGVKENHTATVKEIGDGYVVLTIASTPFDIRINLNESKLINIDGVSVMSAKLVQLKDGQANIVFTRVGSATTNIGAKDSSRPAYVLPVVILAMTCLIFLPAFAKRRTHRQNS